MNNIWRLAGVIATIAPLWHALGCGDARTDRGAQSTSVRPHSIGRLEAACGRPPLAACPMQGWMDANLGEPFNRRRMSRLAPALEALAHAAPAGYARWTHFARQGAGAAARMDWDDVRTSCEGCHQAYRDDYRRTLRQLPLPEALRRPS